MSGAVVTRRRFLAGLAAAGVPFSARPAAAQPVAPPPPPFAPPAPAPPAPAQPLGVAFAPASFDVTTSSALVWLRPHGETEVRVEYGTLPLLGQATLSTAAPASVQTDSTAVIELDRLAPDTEYFYRGVTADGTLGPIGRFRTAPARARPFRFAWSGGMDGAQRPFALLDAVAAFEPDFFLMLGDTILADPAAERVVPSLGYYRAKHGDNRADAALQHMLATTPVYATWDDGEVETGADRTHPALPAARRAFREYWPVRPAGVLYRRFAWTPAVDVFLLDCRSYRSPIGDPDGPAKTMLGAEQKRWLREQLAASTATFKLLASAVPFLPPAAVDEWTRYATERDELRAFLRRERIRNVTILSAGVHTAWEQEQGGLHEFLAGSIGRSSYGAVTVDPGASPPRIIVEIRDAANAVRHRNVVTAA